ncbi:virion core protein, T7 gp14 family [Cupriavidus sp. H39]|uniref:virion core protein, T7 gp14 family n=1 Tax=Cupriavidus sp. H39 TaxID=3401635 RepID=UPI003D082940
MTSLAISAATAAASFVQADHAASKQSDANQRAYDDSVVQARNQQAEQDAQAKDQMSERARQAMVETAHLRALSAESGTTGGTNDRVDNEANFNAGQDMAAISGNAQAAQRQLAQQARGSYATVTSRQAQIQPPSLIGTGLQIGGAYVNYQTSMNKLKGDATVKGST